MSGSLRSRSKLQSSQSSESGQPNSHGTPTINNTHKPSNIQTHNNMIRNGGNDSDIELVSPLDDIDNEMSSISTNIISSNKISNSLSSIWLRIWTSAVMFFGIFIPALYIGHPAMLSLLFLCQVIMYKEIKRLSSLLSRRTALPSFRPLQWYWFWICIFLTYGVLLQQYFNYVIIPYHTFIAFILYCIGVMIFVLTLRNGYYKYQFEMFAWVHLTLLLVVVQSTFIAVNMFQGMIWFALPATLIIFNDSWAYVFGVMFGRTPLIKLSPKKTVEGMESQYYTIQLNVSVNV